MIRWISVQNQLPKVENRLHRYDHYVKCLVIVSTSYYPESPYDEIDSPTEEEHVEVAEYDVDQKIWNIGNGEYALNALIDPEDILDGSFVTHWAPWPKASEGREG